MTRRIALLGLSGVGKSTLIRRLHKKVPLIHLQASALIKAEQAYRAQRPESSECLRLGAIVDNQSLMIAAFQRAVTEADVPIVFDGHSVIDGHNGLVEIPTSVFAQLTLDAIFYLSAEPRLIFERREKDARRDRPLRNIQTLDQHQLIAHKTAERIAGEIGCPFCVIDDNDDDNLHNMLEALSST